MNTAFIFEDIVKHIDTDEFMDYWDEIMKL